MFVIGVWFFPKGYGHALQGLGPDETHFILGFSDGHFSEFGTFSITDWLGHTPADILSKNLGLPESVFATFPKSEVYIVQGQIPVNPFEPLREINPQANQFPHKYSLDAAAYRLATERGSTKLAATEFAKRMLRMPGVVHSSPPFPADIFQMAKTDDDFHFDYLEQHKIPQ